MFFVSRSIALWSLLFSVNGLATASGDLDTRQASQCNIRGTAKNVQHYKTFSVPSKDACGQKCKDDYSCSMFGYCEQSKQCYFYKLAKVTNNVRANSKADRVYSDKSCVKAAAPAPTTTTATTKASSPSNAVLLPLKDSTIDCSDLRNIIPRPQLTLVYAEKSPGTYMMKIAASMKPQTQGVLLENIAAVTKVTCSGTGLVLDFSDPNAAASAMLRWKDGVALITKSTGCNSDNERGVYIIQGKPTAVNSKQVKVSARKVTLQDVVSQMEITYGQVVSKGPGKSFTTYTRTATSYYTNNDGALTSTTFLTTVTPTATTVTTTRLSSSTTISKYTTSVSSTTAPTVAASPSSTTTSSSVSSSSTSQATTSSTTQKTTTQSTTVGSAATTTTSAAPLHDGLPPLLPSEKAVLDEIISNLPAPDADGDINVPVSRKPRLPSSMDVDQEPLNMDPAYQAQLQDAMTADGLDSPETLVDQAVDDLSGDETSNVQDGGPVQLSSADNEPRGDDYYDNLPLVEALVTTPTKRSVVPARTLKAAPPSENMARNIDLRRAQAYQMSKRDGWDTFFDVMGDDFVGEICKPCELVAAGKALYDIGACVFGGKCGSPPQVTIKSLVGTGSQEFKYKTWFPKGALYQDSKGAVVTAENVGLDITSFNIQGKVQVTPKQANFKDNFVVSADVTAVLSMTSNAVYGIRLKEAGSGSYNAAAKSVPSQQFTIPDVFTLSAKFIWGQGMSWDSSIPLDTKAGAVMATIGGRSDFNVKARTMSNWANWEPSAQVTYPKFDKPGRAILTPYFKVDIKISLMIFGQYLEDAVTLTDQVNMGFDAQVLAASESVKRDISSDMSATSDLASLEERGFPVSASGFASSILKRVAEAVAAKATQANGAAPPKTCDAGSMKINAFMTTKTVGSVSKDQKELFSNKYRFGAQCIPFAKTGGTPTTPPKSSTSSATPSSPPKTNPSTTPSDPNTPPAACGNEGVQFGIWTQQLNPDLHIDVIKTSGREDSNSGTTTSLSGFTTQAGTGFLGALKTTNTVYGKTFRGNNWAVVHRGYLIARKSGEYTFNFGIPDDQVYLWVGDKAISGWSTDNADLVSLISDSPAKQFKMQLEKGKYYPLRFLYAQYSGPIIFEGGITDPDGQTVLSTASGTTGWVVQRPCDGMGGGVSSYAAWGQES